MSDGNRFIRDLQFLIEELIKIPDSEDAKKSLRMLAQVDMEPEFKAIKELRSLYVNATLQGRVDHADMLAAMLATVCLKGIKGLPLTITAQ